MEKTLKAQMEEMEVGEVKAWPSTRYPSIRSTASQLGFMTGRKYRCTASRETMTVMVTRES